MPKQSARVVPVEREHLKGAAPVDDKDGGDSLHLASPNGQEGSSAAHSLPNANASGVGRKRSLSVTLTSSVAENKCVRWLHWLLCRHWHEDAVRAERTIVRDVELGREVRRDRPAGEVYALRALLTLGPLLLLLAMMCLAPLEELLYRVLGSTLWFGAFAYVTWVPMRDSSIGLLSELALRRIGTAVAVVPLCASVTELVCLAAGASVWIADLSARTLAYTLMWVCLPATLHYLRLRAARLRTPTLWRALIAPHVKRIVATKGPAFTTKSALNSLARSLLRSQHAHAHAHAHDAAQQITLVRVSRKNNERPTRIANEQEVGDVQDTGNVENKAAVAFAADASTAFSPTNIAPDVTAAAAVGESPRASTCAREGYVATAATAAYVATTATAASAATAATTASAKAAVGLPPGAAALRDSSARASAASAASLRSSQVSLLERQTRAAIVLQARVRQRIGRALAAKRRTRRKEDMARFSWPIVVASFGSLSVQLWCLHVKHNDPERYAAWPIVWQHSWWMLLLLPPVAVLLYDRFYTTKQFSLAHALFFVTILWSVCYRITPAAAALYDELQTTFGASREGSISIAMLFCYSALYAALLFVGKCTLSLIAIPRTFCGLLFPFQMFDMAFIYSFFSIRSYSTGVTWSWLFVSILLQVHVALRNSGSYLGLLFALSRAWQQRWRPMLTSRCGGGGAARKPVRATADPLMTIVWVASIAIQYDIADSVALLALPTLVSFLVWRDGEFSIQNTGIVVLSCDLTNIWIRFAILGVLHPLASMVARRILSRRMNQTVLGQATLFGRSRFVSGKKLRNAAAVHAAFNLSEVQRCVLRADVSLLNLDYRYLTRRIVVKSYAFFACWIYIALIAALRRHDYAPRDVFDAASSPHVVPERVPWVYVPRATAAALDARLADALALRTDGACATRVGWFNASSPLLSDAWLLLTQGSTEDANAVTRKNFYDDDDDGGGGANDKQTQKQTPPQGQG